MDCDYIYTWRIHVYGCVCMFMFAWANHMIVTVTKEQMCP